MIVFSAFIPAMNFLTGPALILLVLCGMFYPVLFAKEATKLGFMTGMLIFGHPFAALITALSIGEKKLTREIIGGQAPRELTDGPLVELTKSEYRVSE